MPFDPRALSTPFRMQPGLRRVAPGTPAVQAAPPGSAAFAAKLAALQREVAASQGQDGGRAHCLVGLPGSAIVPALRRVAEAAALHCPEALTWTQDGLRSTALGLGCTPAGALQAGSGTHAPAHAVLQALPADHRAAGLLSLALVEDLALIDAASARLPWMAVCLPSHWDPAEKVGLDFRSVHAPVAESQTVQAAGPQLLRLVSAGEAWERFVWTLTLWPGLDQHPLRHTRRAWPNEASPAELLDLAILRTERQGFLPIVNGAEAEEAGASTGQAVFTIEVQARPLRQALAQEFAPAGVSPGQLADALASMSDAVLAYRSLTPVRDRLVEGLRALG